MRIVEEIHRDPTVTTAGSLYLKKTTEQFHSGWKATVLITSRCPITGESSDIEIEGPAAAVRYALQKALDGINSLQDGYCEDGFVRPWLTEEEESK